MTHKPMNLVFDALASAHYWARLANGHDHQTMILPAQFVAGSRQGQKTDSNDAIACPVAGHHPNARPVAIKTETQQAMQAVERTQQALTKQSTALNNMLISFLFEFGINMPKRSRGRARRLPEILEDIEGQRSHLSKSPHISTHLIGVFSCEKEGVHISSAGATAERDYCKELQHRHGTN